MAARAKKQAVRVKRDIVGFLGLAGGGRKQDWHQYPATQYFVLEAQAVRPPQFHSPLTIFSWPRPERLYDQLSALKRRELFLFSILVPPHVSLLSPILAASTIGLAAFILRGNSRKRAKARLRQRVQKIVTRRIACLHDPELVGAGNVGAVFAADLQPGWEQELGIQWRADGTLPTRVAVKFAVFRDNTERLRSLMDLAPRLERHLATCPDFPLCPFLALGLWRQPNGRSYLIEVMPLIPGTNLDKRLLPGRLPVESLEQLARILDTVLFLERHKFYTRNIDAENVLVDSDGRWVRLDFDNAKPVKTLPLLRMQRLARLTRQVLEALPFACRDAAWVELHRRAAATEQAPLKQWHRRGVPPQERDAVFLSCEDLAAAVRALPRESAEHTCIRAVRSA
ncbi:MAG: Protein kinase domain [Candidatus Sumerlaeota bacterium]|nr:Protein kinase domain [Candidatus Sumerlaeota bacterium]